MNLDQILRLLAQYTDTMAELLGADPSKHGMLRGTFEAAIAEAQGAELVKVRNFTPAIQSYNHYQSMREAANSLQNSITGFRTTLGQLRAVDPRAAEIADRSFRPLVESASLRVQLARQTEQMIIEIGNTGNSTRLQGVPLNLGRDQAGLVSNQLRQMNLNLVPQGISQGSSLIDRIKQLPITSNEAKEQIKTIALWVSGTIATARRALQTAATRAFSATMELLTAFGSRFTSVLPPIPKDQLKSWNPNDPSNLY